MTDLVLNHMTNGQNISVANNNFDLIEDKINKEVILSTGGNNTLYQDLDVNSNNLLNIKDLSVQSLTVAGYVVVPSNLTALSQSLVNQWLTTPSAIGSVTPNSGAFTTLTSTGTTSLGPLSASSLNATPIGAATASTGKFTTLVATSTANFFNLALSSTTNSTSSSTGSLTTLGGLGVALDLWCGGTYHGLAAITGGSVDNTPIGSTTKSSGAFTTLSATGVITPSQTAGIAGTTTNNNANAGSVGEFITATATGVALTNSVVTNITSISLTPGDWDVECTVSLNGGANNITVAFAGTNSVSATAGPLGSYTQFSYPAGNICNVAIMPSPTQRYSVASNTTIYCLALAGFSSGAVTAGGIIRARRVR